MSPLGAALEPPVIDGSLEVDGAEPGADGGMAVVGSPVPGGGGICPVPEDCAPALAATAMLKLRPMVAMMSFCIVNLRESRPHYLRARSLLVP